MRDTIPARADIPEEFKWKLEDLYADDSAWEQDFSSMPEAMRDLAVFHGKLAQDAGTLLRCLTLLDTLEERALSIYAYAHMRRDQDNESIAKSSKSHAGIKYCFIKLSDREVSVSKMVELRFKIRLLIRNMINSKYPVFMLHSMGIATVADPITRRFG